MWRREKKSSRRQLRSQTLLLVFVCIVDFDRISSCICMINFAQERKAKQSIYSYLPYNTQKKI